MERAGPGNRTGFPKKTARSSAAACAEGSKDTSRTCVARKRTIWSSSGAFSMSVIAPALYCSCTQVTAHDSTSRVAVPPLKPTKVKRSSSASLNSLYMLFSGYSRLSAL